MLTPRRLLLTSAVALLLIIALIVAANQIIQQSAAPFISDDVDLVPSRTVAIVPGARVYTSGQVSAALEDRLHTALQLYRRAKVDYILVSGDHHQKGYDEVNAMQSWLVDHGVPVHAIYLDHAGLRTFDTMVRAREVFHVHDAIITTQAFHLDRSIFLARQAGIDAVGVSADRRIYLRAKSDRRRERLARTIALLDTLNPLARPRHLGSPIPIGTAPATQTHDPSTRIF